MSNSIADVQAATRRLVMLAGLASEISERLDHTPERERALKQAHELLARKQDFDDSMARLWNSLERLLKDCKE